ncbi:MAG: DegT/DnrJ/EryC1/StrS aminotransferase family protein [Clostridia bacterium]|nr:DegT/DnrJ/EryC1/StrS aminotransferase family protein [Clostridia bacterium]
MNVPFSPPDITEAEIAKVVETLRSGWITTGPKTKELERRIAEMCSTEKAVCLNSQTACAEMVLHILGIGEGDEVIVPAYTYTASASVVHHVGAKIVLVDCQQDSLEMDYEKMAAVITPKTKAVIAVDLAGIPCNYEKIYEIVDSKKDMFTPNSEMQKALGRIAVMADTAHSLGAKRFGKPAGSLADFSSFSFHAVKNLTTAEGGALTWNKIEGINSDDIYKSLQLLSLHGQSKDALAKTQLGAWEYDIAGLYYKCNMTDVAAAMGLAQIERYDKMLSRRKDIVMRYDAAFSPLGVKTLSHYTNENESSGHLYITRVPGITNEQRNEIIIKMAELGISCNVHYKPLPMHTAYKKLGFDIKDYPNAYKHFENEITLPLNTCLTDEQVDFVIESYIKVLKEYI